MKMMSLAVAVAVGLGCANVAGVVGAKAQDYPSRPVTMIVPFPAGGPTDTLGRLLGERMRVSFGQPIVIENVTGAGSTIGVTRAAQAAPDGYTLILGNWTSFVGSGALYRTSYDLLKDFAPVSLVSQFFNAVSLHPSVPAKSVKELIALGCSRELLMGSAGNGSTSHLAGELFRKMTGVKMTHVPYKSGGQLVTGVVSGESHLSFSPVSTALTHMKTGKLRTIAVTSPKRLPSLPDLPAAAETVPGYEFGGWQAVFVPAGTSPDVVRRLNAAILKGVNTAEFRDYLAKEGSELVGSTPEQLAGFLRNEVTRNAELIKSAGIKAE